MSVLVKYTKAQYAEKLAELEGYYSQLNTHLSTMQGLKEQMYQFWDDENARSTGNVLASEIRQVKNAMDRTNDLIIFYKGSIEKLDEANLGAGSVVGEALDILGKLGI